MTNLEEFITGYQWAPKDKKFMGEYVFPNNKDKEEIHMPPFTTLIKPPILEKGYSVYWDGNNWYTDVDPSLVIEHPPIDDYGLLMPDYIQYLKETDLWTDEDEIAWKDAEDKKLERDRIREEIERNRDYLQELRVTRNDILSRSDWTQLPDAQSNLSENEINLWSSYRQSLRNLPETVSDPKSVFLDLKHKDWPISPEGKTPAQIYNLI